MRDDEQAPGPPAESAEAVLGRWWRLLWRPMVRWARRGGLDHDEAEDAVQAAFVRAMAGWPRFDGRRPEGWLWQMLRFEVLSRHAAGRRSAARLAPVHADDLEGPQDVLLDAACAQRCGALEAAIEAMDPVARVIAWGLASGASDADVLRRVADDTGVALSADSLRQRRTRVRASLQQVASQSS